MYSYFGLCNFFLLFVLDVVVQEEHHSEMFLDEYICLKGASQNISEGQSGEMIPQTKFVFEELSTLNLNLSHPGE